jgi:NADH-quinone oxidoreductase subunit C
LATKIHAELGGIVGEIKVVSPTCLSTTTESSKILEVAGKLESMGFDHVKSVTAIDYLPPEPKIDMVYHISYFLNSELANFIVELQTSLDRQNPKIASVVDIWPSAEYPERETLDLMGVTFDGLPQKDRLFLMDNFEGGPPLRKDFKLKTEGIDA